MPMAWHTCSRCGGSYQTNNPSVPCCTGGRSPMPASGPGCILGLFLALVGLLRRR